MDNELKTFLNDIRKDIENINTNVKTMEERLTKKIDLVELQTNLIKTDMKTMEEGLTKKIDSVELQTGLLKGGIEGIKEQIKTTKYALMRI